MAVLREHMNLYLTKPVADELHRLVPARERMCFMEEILERELSHGKRKAPIQSLAGAWKDEDHPDTPTGEDIDRWIEDQCKLGTLDWSEEGGRNE